MVLVEGMFGFFLVLGILFYLYSNGKHYDSKSENYSNSDSLPRANPTINYSSQSTTGEFVRSTEGYIPTDRCRCGGKWVKYVNKVNGGRFFGCSRYPQCENTRERQIADNFCVNGHKRTVENTSYNADGSRRCLICRPIPKSSLPDESSFSMFCKNGHMRTYEDTYVRPDGKRECKICRKNNRLQSPAGSDSSSTNLFCRNGHLRTNEDTYVRPDGERECRICRRNARK